MAKIKYVAKENVKTGTHSFYAAPIPNGTLSFDELLEEACEDNTYDIDEMRGCVGRFMKADLDGLVSDGELQFFLDDLMQLFSDIRDLSA